MYYSQHGQDKFLNEHIFNDQKNGIFVDIGAHDGKTISNTYFFEKELNWTGVCVEPILERYVDLVKNRNCICMNCCVYNKHSIVPFAQSIGYTEMLSGIQETYDPRHLTRLKNEQSFFGGTTNILNKVSYTLSEILTLNHIDHVDYLSIDTEGSELQILQGIDFEKFKIKVIDVENNYPDVFEPINTLLISKNYKKLVHIGGDDIYVINS